MVSGFSGKTVLVVWGGWEGHEPRQSVELFVPWLRDQGFDVLYHDGFSRLSGHDVDREGPTLSAVRER